MAAGCVAPQAAANLRCRVAPPQVAVTPVAHGPHRHSGPMTTEPQGRHVDPTGNRPRRPPAVDTSQASGGSGRPADQAMFRPVARTAADVLAIIPHTLGYWPARSLVMLTATSSGLGPCLRVDLPDAADFADPAFAAEWTMQISELLEHDPVGHAVFVAVYGEPVRSTGASSDRRSGPAPALDVRHVSPSLGGHVSHVVNAVAEAGALSGHDVRDAWCVDNELWWPVADVGDARPVREILDSAVYVALVVDGSVVEPPDGSTESGTTGREPLQADRQLRRRLALLAEVAATTDWSPRSLEVWDAILSPFDAPDSRHPADPVRRLQELTRTDLLHLLAGTTDPLGCDLVLSLVLSGDIEAARHAWDGWNRTSSDEDLHGLVHTAQVMLGDWDGTPRWDRVDRCVDLVQVLIGALTGPNDPEGQPSPGEEAVRCTAPRVSDRWAGGVAAGLWVVLGHLERFRARGSKVDQCARTAESLAPGHPGVARLREIMTLRPIPHWATDPATAWRRARQV